MKAALPVCGYSFISSIIKSYEENNKYQSESAPARAANLIKTFREKAGIPGICVHVNVDYGYSDIENLETCKSHTVMRIASISKSLTSLIAAKLVDEGLLDLDKDINEYLPEFPKKTFDSKKVAITCRQLLSHRSGIRSYKQVKELSEYDLPEFLNKEHCSTSLSTRKCFQDDDLQYAPDQKLFYSGYGYVLLGSVLEKVAQKSIVYGEKIKNHDESIQPIEIMFKTLFRNLGLSSTYCEYHEEIIMNRSSQYRRNCNKKCQLEKSPYVDNSCKWTAGGIISTCQDLSKVAEHLIEIWFGRKDGIISRKSLEELWKPIEGNIIKVDSKSEWLYGLGWCVSESEDRMSVCHLGGACGGTSALLINLPKNDNVDDYVIVTILCNMEKLSDNIGDVAVQISKLFLEERHKNLK